MDNDYDNQDSSSPIGRSLGDIRIHDSAQAGELVRRLGARAFTVGRDIYVRSDLVNAGTPEGEALLAHEVTHAMEQTGGSVADMPLLRPQAYRSALSGGSGSSGGSVNVQRTAATGGANPASLPSSEARAEATEASTLQSARASQSGGGQSGARQAEPENTQSVDQPNAEEIAERVYELMLREMVIDIERSANL